MIADIIAGFLSGLLGSMGLGGGGILIIYFTLIRNIPQTQAQGINLTFYIPIAILSVVLHTKKHLIDWKIAVKYIFFGVIGLIIGSLIVNMVNESILSKIFSIILILLGIRELISKKDK